MPKSTELRDNSKHGYDRCSTKVLDSHVQNQGKKRFIDNSFILSEHMDPTADQPVYKGYDIHSKQEIVIKFELQQNKPSMEAYVFQVFQENSHRLKYLGCRNFSTILIMLLMKNQTEI